MCAFWSALLLDVAYLSNEHCWWFCLTPAVSIPLISDLYFAYLLCTVFYRSQGRSQQGRPSSEINKLVSITYTTGFGL
jgi:hypothetical protein